VSNAAPPSPHRPPPRGRGPVASALAAGCGALLLAAATGCSGGADGPDVVVPSPDGEAAGVCRSLAGALPERVDGLDRVTPSADSPYVAAWGDPAVVLRCGVAEPPVLVPGSDTYNPVPDIVGVNEVDWVVEETDGARRFTTYERQVFVEVTVPDDYEPNQVSPLVDLAAPVAGAVPAAADEPAP
jgi:hypothetical protein